jgi:hypothetical protein
VDPATLSIRQVIRLNKLGGDAHRDSSAEGKGTPNYLAGMAVSHDGSRLLVVSNKMNTDRGTLTGDDLDQDNSVRNLLTVIDTASSEVVQSIDIDNNDSASAVCFSPLGDYFFVTLQGNNDLSVFDTYSLATSSGLGAFLSRQRIGKAPRGLCVDPVTDRLFVKNFLSRNLTVFELEGFTARGRADFPKVSVPTVETETLAETILRGKQVFYDASDPRMSGEGYLSCATCHVDGGHDGRTWDFTGRGEGLRNTTTLLGKGGLAQGNLHWSANFDELQDFEHDIRNAFGGTGFLTNAQFSNTGTPGGNPKAGLNPDLDALADYVTSLGHETIPRSPHRTSAGELTTAAEAGSVIFEREGCATCHSGSEMTDGLVHDIGTLRDTSGGRPGVRLPGIETPTLKGIWESAPYFHNGSAGTLEEVFTAAGGTSIQTEAGATNGNASIETEWTEYNNDATLRGGGLAQVWEGGTLTFTEVDGGSGGVGAVEVRYSSGYSEGTLTIRVNGTEYHTSVSPTGNLPDWRYVNWDSRRFEAVQLTAGTTNTIEIFVSEPVWLPVAVDELLISTPDDLAKAAPHRKVSSLNQGEQDQLLAFLRQLDGSTADETPAPPLTPDGLRISQSQNGFPLLQWDASPGSSAYRVYRSNDSSFSNAGLLAETAALSFTDETAELTDSFFYWVTALNSSGESAIGSAVQKEALDPDPPPLPLPDLSIGKSRATMIGDDIYTGRQTYFLSVQKGRIARAFFTLQNDSGSDHLLLSAPRKDRSVNVRYFQKKGGRRNVTATITSGRHRVADLAPGRTDPFQMLIRAAGKANRKNLPIRALAESSPDRYDRVILRLIAR